MSNPFVGEIRMFAGTFAPSGWHFCDGSLMAIADNETLFTLIGTIYGGDGQTTYGLPDLRGRVPLHFGGAFVQGQAAGAEAVTLNNSQLPAHRHGVIATTAIGGASSPGNSLLAQGPPGGVQIYTQDNSVLPTPTPLSPVGGNQAHENHQPLLTVSFIIALFGIFPSRN